MGIILFKYRGLAINNSLKIQMSYKIFHQGHCKKHKLVAWTSKLRPNRIPIVNYLIQQL